MRTKKGVRIALNFTRFLSFFLLCMFYGNTDDLFQVDSKQQQQQQQSTSNETSNENPTQQKSLYPDKSIVMRTGMNLLQLQNLLNAHGNFKK